MSGANCTWYEDMSATVSLPIWILFCFYEPCDLAAVLLPMGGELGAGPAATPVADIPGPFLITQPCPGPPASGHENCVHRSFQLLLFSGHGGTAFLLAKGHEA